MFKSYSNNKGHSLIESILSLALISIILMLLLPICRTYFTFHNKLGNKLSQERNTRFALNYIEKEFGKFSRNSIVYIPEKQSIKGKDYMGRDVWIDLSGQRRNDKNTLIYFHKTNGEIRINKDGENNVLCNNIEDISIKEIIENELLEITITAKQTDYSISTIIRIISEWG